MERMKKIIDSVLYAVLTFCILFIIGLALGFTHHYGDLFSFAGLIAMSFLALSILLD